MHMRDPHLPEETGRILIHNLGAGVPSPEVVEQRARELAVIAGRAASDYTPADFAQAKRELLQGGLPADDVEEAADTVSDRDDVPGESGQQVRNIVPGDESSVAEELVNEGLEEALHDEMVQASKKDLDEAS